MIFEEAQKLYNKYKPLEGDIFIEPQGSRDIKLIEVRYALKTDLIEHPIPLDHNKEPSSEQKEKGDIRIIFISIIDGNRERVSTNQFLTYSIKE